MYVCVFPLLCACEREGWVVKRVERNNVCVCMYYHIVSYIASKYMCVRVQEYIYFNFFSELYILDQADDD